MDPRPTLFPARLTAPDGTVTEPVKVATDTAGVTRAWWWSPDTGEIFVVGEWPAVELVPAPGRGRPRSFTAADGTTIERGKGCGCGHPLKRFRPNLIAEPA